MKKKLNIADYEKFLIVQTAFLGDVAISLELVEAIKHFNPKSYINFITTPQASEIVDLSDFVTKIHQFDKKNYHKTMSATSNFAKEITQAKKYDCIISLHKSFRTSFLVSKLKADIKIGFQDSVFSSFVYNYRAKSNFSLSEHYRVLTPLSIFGINFLDYQIGNYSITFPSEVKSKIDQLLIENQINGSFIVIAPGSVWNTKKWGANHYAELVKLLDNEGKKSVLVGGKGDIEDCRIIEESTNSINLSGKTTIKELIYLISRAQLVVSNDSAPVHFANIVKTPVIAIFGPTSPIFGFAPIGPSDIVIENKDLKCRPCQIHGSQRCPLGTLECMNSISKDYVFNTVINKLNSL